MIKNYLTWPWIVSVPLLLGGFGCSVFFIGTDSPLLAPAILTLLAYAVLAVYPNFKSGWAIPKTNSFVFVILFWLWLVVSMFWATTPYVSTMFTIILSILPVFFIVSILSPNADDWVKIHGLALWCALGLFAVWALIQFFFLFEEYGPRIRHPMLNPNNLSGLFNMGIFPAMGMFFLSNTRRNITFSGVVVALFYAALVVTQSRSGFISFSICTVLFVSIAVFKTKTDVPWKKLVFLMVVAFFVPFLSNIYNEGALERNLVGATLKNFSSLDDRFYLWESTWNMIKDHFLLGTGLASFYFYYPRYRMPLDRSDGFFSHMDPLQFWAETGIMAPILFYGILICVLLRTINSVRAAGPDLKRRIEVMAPFCGMLALIGHTHMTFHLYMPGMLLPLSALLAYWYMATERALGDAGARILFNPAFKMKVTVIAVFVFILLLTAGWTARVSATTYLIKQVRKEAGQNNPEEANRILDLAGRIAPGSYASYHEYKARFWIERLWNNKSKAMDKSEAQKIYDSALYYLDEAEKRNPAFTVIWNLRARLHASVDGVLIDNGQELAVDLLTKVIDANPMAADSRVGLANIYRARGEIKKALRVLEGGLQWPRAKGRTDVSFLMAIAQLKLQLGDKQGHNNYMAEAQKRAQLYGMIAKK